MSLNYKKHGLIMLSTIVALLPLIFIKKYIQNKQIIHLIIAMILYFLLMLSYIKLFEQTELSSTYTVLQILQILIVLFIGILIFNESITINKLIGIIFGILSIYLLLS
jgi:multidrug transporter EmrE-like cation transporter